MSILLLSSNSDWQELEEVHIPSGGDAQHLQAEGEAGRSLDIDKTVPAALPANLSSRPINRGLGIIIPSLDWGVGAEFVLT